MNYASFFSYAIIQIFTPGPNNIMAMNNAASFGIASSIGFDFGVMAGFFIIMIASCLFSSALYAIVPTIKPVVTVIGAAYILYLAWRTIASGRHGDDSRASIRRFLPGVMVQFINPKGLLMALTMSSVYITPSFTSFWPMLGLSALLGVMCLASTLVWGLFGSMFQKFFTGHRKLVNAVMALLLLYCAVSLFL
ncbi:MAG TPA: LysE family transporter [Bacillota bacterium]|nr:LysE family transporter [Bacillota bacterium]HOH09448.1 LysE family transporter [Bacillota bacterium]HOS50107.1 LysE family transporter [Bacillota bacterium]HOY89126.1 LysE family transporter [Bacillota bacterium]HPI00971.1 LysE family transporter [Bacillota bacterium]